MKNQEGGAARLWSEARTPYMRAIQDACDDDRYRMVVVVGPERSGKSVGGENLLFKRLKHGPLTNTDIYYPPGLIDDYAAAEFADLFDLHIEDIGRFLDPRPKFNKLRLKVCKGKRIRLVAANAANFRQKEAAFIIVTEIDGLPPKLASKAINEIRGRQKSFGRQAKSYIESHPDLGWDGAVVPGWRSGTKGVFYWRCPQCDGWSTPHQLAADDLRAKMYYQEDDALDEAGQDDLAAETAMLQLPCGCLIGDDDRYKMIDGLVAVHDGMSIDEKGNIVGQPKATDVASFWLHGFQVKRPLGPLAREHIQAVRHFKMTRKIDLLKRYHVKSIGETFESAADLVGLNPDKLKNRTKTIAAAEKPVSFNMGVAPDGVRFITVAVDVQHNHFDVLVRGWDLEKRSWLIDRYQIYQRRHKDGVVRNIDLKLVQDDWHVLDEVLDRLTPLQSDPTRTLPVAVMTIDGSDGNTTRLAYEYARRMSKKTWGGWHRVRVIKGVGGAGRPHLGSVSFLSKDTNGVKIEPPISYHDLGVDGLKDDILGNDEGVGLLLIDDGSPGQVYFPGDFPRNAYEEIFAEKKIDGKYVRGGRPNETLDLLAYTEAGRLMLEPDRKDRDWTPGREPIWAKPVSLSGESTPETVAPVAAVSSKPTLASRLSGLDVG